MPTTEDKHPVRNGILVTVGGGVLLVAALFVLSRIPAAWHYMASIFSQVGAHLVSYLSIPFWLFYILLLMGVPFLVRCLLRLRRHTGPQVGDYTSDRFLEVDWTWHYVRGNAPEGIWCFCPDDNTRLVYAAKYYPHFITLKCETCERTWGPFPGKIGDLQNKIERQIERKIRTGEWKTAILTQAREQTAS